MSDTLERGRKIAEEIGLHLHRVWGDQVLPKYYHEDDIHRLLGESVEVFSFEKQGWHKSGWRDSKGPDTHAALLIAIRPIEQEPSMSDKELADLIKQLIATGEKYGAFGREKFIPWLKDLLAKERK